MSRRWFLIGALLLLTILPTAAQEPAVTFTDAPTDTTYTVEPYVAQANFPVGMAFAPDGRLFYNEKVTGNVRVVTPDGELLREPVINLPTDALQERGMLGIAVAPDFETSQQLYVVHTLPGTARDYAANRLVRFTVGEDNIATDEAEELMRVPIETGYLLHNGGNVHFDDDGHLYLSLGDYGEAAYAQDLTTPHGAIHRFSVTDDGLVPAEGNPFGDDNSIYAYGLRNPFDFTIDPNSKLLYASESGPTCDDEINAIIAGFNYGWGEGYECAGEDFIPGLDRYAPPMLTYTPPIAPTGIVVYEGEAFPQWQGDLFFCDWVQGRLQRVDLNEGRTQAEAIHEIDLGEADCRIDLTIGNDGALYFGTVGNDSGVIYRLAPAAD